MKKFYVFALCLFAGFSAAYAQDEEDELDDTFQFVTADGTVVPSGSTITVTDVEEDFVTGDKMLKSGLYVKANSNGYVTVAYDVDAPADEIQLCFPINCTKINGTGETGVGMLKADDEPHDLQTEWFPSAYGTATVSYTLKRYEYAGMGGPLGITPQYDYLSDCSTVTVIYAYNDPAGIEGIKASDNVVSAVYYDMAGRMIQTPGKGLYIKKAKLADGTVKTVKTVLK